MKFDVLRKSHVKKNIIIGVVVVVVIAAIVIGFTKAKFKTAQTISLINGTVNYSLADLNAVAVYLQDEGVEGGYRKADTIPTEGYIFNEDASYCTVNGTRDDNISLTYNPDTQSLSVAPLTTKGTKCYLYFDESLCPEGATACNTILAGKTQGNRGSLGSAFSTNTTGEYFTTTDWDGTTYYFAGNPSDNWVKFAGYYWRIIRVNGDGSIRLIYQGTSANTTGSGTQIKRRAFNSTYNHSRYVGLVYGTSSQQHGYGNNSTIMGELNTWYTNNIQNKGYASYIDTGAGFCSDRGPTSSSWTNAGFNYAAYDRIRGGNPSLDCSDEDILSKDNGRLDNPIGLITADEVMYGGIPNWNSSNTSNYLYTGQTYWTMSPFGFYSTGRALVFSVSSSGYLGNGSVDNADGVRPVINLKANTAISSGNGQATSPFVIST